MPDARCTCPPVVDVMRGRVTETRYECPVHPTPTFPPGTFMPRIDTTDLTFATFPLEQHQTADPAGNSAADGPPTADRSTRAPD